MKKIMVATDFSERSDRALRRAVLLARQFEAGIALVHVVDDDQPRGIVDSERAEAEKLLRHMASALREGDGVACETKVLSAAPFMGIVQAVQDEVPDLLIIGSHRRQILRDVFVGTTAERIIRSVACPVLMVNAAPAGDYNHVLQATDLSDGSRDALQRLASLRIAEHARKTALYVFDAPALRLARIETMANSERENYLQNERLDAARQLSAFLSSAGILGIETILRYEAMPASYEILKAAEEEGADLVVLSTHSRSGLAKFVIGSVTEQLLRMSPVDMLAIPPRPAIK